MRLQVAVADIHAPTPRNALSKQKCDVIGGRPERAFHCIELRQRRYRCRHQHVISMIPRPPAAAEPYSRPCKNGDAQSSTRNTSSPRSPRAVQISSRIVLPTTASTPSPRSAAAIRAIARTSRSVEASPLESIHEVHFRPRGEIARSDSIAAGECVRAG